MLLYYESANIILLVLLQFANFILKLLCYNFLCLRGSNTIFKQNVFFFFFLNVKNIWSFCLLKEERFIGDANFRNDLLDPIKKRFFNLQFWTLFYLRLSFMIWKCALFNKILVITAKSAYSASFFPEIGVIKWIIEILYKIIFIIISFSSFQMEEN